VLLYPTDKSLNPLPVAWLPCNWEVSRSWKTHMIHFLVIFVKF
jgi:hypothetical protein